MTVELTDETLVDGILAGDEGSFGLLYERYRRPVYSTAFRIIQSTEEARDVTQEVFLKLFRSLAQWKRQRASLSTWLYRLAANHAIDCWRARRRRSEDSSENSRLEELGDRLHMDEAFRSSQERLESLELVEEVRRAVDRLPELQKKVFVLRYFQEMKLEEIAGLEGCSLGTIKTSLFRATQTVRKALRRHQESKR